MLTNKANKVKSMKVLPQTPALLPVIFKKLAPLQ